MGITSFAAQASEDAEKFFLCLLHVCLLLSPKLVMHVVISWSHSGDVAHKKKLPQIAPKPRPAIKLLHVCILLADAQAQHGLNWLYTHC